VGRIGQKSWNRIHIDDDRLTYLYLHERRTAKEIASILGIGANPVYRRLRELRITRSNSESHKGQKPGNYKGRYLDGHGYVVVHMPENHPYRCMSGRSRYGSGYVREHRLVMAQHLGRPLESWEVVHQINHDRKDNRIENLQLMKSQTHHQGETLMHSHLCDMKQQIRFLKRENARLRIERIVARAALWVVAMENECANERL
jgi:hypothetical protein